MNGALSYRDLDLQAKQIEACVQRLQRALQEDTLRPQLQVASLLTAAVMVLQEHFRSPDGHGSYGQLTKMADEQNGRIYADKLVEHGPVAVKACLGRLSLLIAKEASLAEAIDINPVEINGKRLLE